MSTPEERQRPPRLTIKPNPSKAPARVVLRDKAKTAEVSKSSSESSVSAVRISPGKASSLSRQGIANSSPSKSSIKTRSPQTRASHGSLSSTRSPPKTTAPITSSNASPGRAPLKASQTLTSRPTASSLRTTVRRPPWGSSTVLARPARSPNTSIVPGKDDPFRDRRERTPEKQVSVDNSQDDLDINSKVRSLINKNEHSPKQSDSTVKSIKSPKSPKSVRWDPAVIFCSPPIVEKPPPPKLSPTSDDFEDCLKTVFSWKKGDRRKLQLLLDTLKQIDDEEQTPLAAKNEVTKDQHALEKLFQDDDVEDKGATKRSTRSKDDERPASAGPRPILRNTRYEGDQLALDHMQSNQDRLFERMKLLQTPNSKQDDHVQGDDDMWFGENKIPARPSPVAIEKLPGRNESNRPSTPERRSGCENSVIRSPKKAPKDGFKNFRRTLKYSECSEKLEDFTPTAKPDFPKLFPGDENRRYLNMLKKIGIVTSPQEGREVDFPNSVRKDALTQNPLSAAAKKKLNPRARSFNLSSSSSSDWELDSPVYSDLTSTGSSCNLALRTPETSVQEDSATSLNGDQIDYPDQKVPHVYWPRRADNVSEPIPELGARHASKSRYFKRRDTVSDPSPLYDEVKIIYPSEGSEDGQEINAVQPKASESKQKEYTHRWIAYLERSSDASSTNDVHGDPIMIQDVPTSFELQAASKASAEESAQRMRAFLEKISPAAEGDKQHLAKQDQNTKNRHPEYPLLSNTDSNDGFTVVTHRRRQQSPVQRPARVCKTECLDPVQRDVDATIIRFSEIVQIPAGIPRRRRHDPKAQPWREVARSTLEPPGHQLISAAVGRNKRQGPYEKAISKLSRIPLDQFKSCVSDKSPSNSPTKHQVNLQEVAAKLKNSPFLAGLAHDMQGSDSSTSKAQLALKEGKGKSVASQSKLRVADSQSFVPGLAMNPVPEQKSITPHMMPEPGEPIWINTSQQFQQPQLPFQIMPEVREPIWINTSQHAEQASATQPVHQQEFMPLDIPFLPYSPYFSSPNLEYPVDPNVSYFPWATNDAPESYNVDPPAKAVEDAAPSGGKRQREARQMHPDWANQILNSFQSKYPKTGTPVPRPPMIKAPRRPRNNPDNKHAAVIQQRLEFLILQRKEEEALKKLMVGELPAVGGKSDGKRKWKSEGSSDSTARKGSVIAGAPYYGRIFHPSFF